ncbi:MAG: hypothetical protein AB7S48_17130 [Bacteroidales bacterium]
MKRVLFILGLFISSIAYSQTQWKDFIGSFPKIDVPFALDVRIVKKTILISRNDAWKYIIEPATRINALKKTDLSHSFPIDSIIVYNYHQWDNLDLNKKDTLEFYSPLIGYRISGLAKFTINQNFQGIIWYLYPGKEMNISFGSKACFWLFTYDKNGNVTDIVELNSEEGNYSMCLVCSSYSICRAYYSNSKINLRINEVTISPINEDDYSPDAKTEKKYSETTYVIGDNGLIK